MKYSLEIEIFKKVEKLKIGFYKATHLVSSFFTSYFLRNKELVHF